MGRSYTVNGQKGHPGFTALVVILVAVCVTAFIASTGIFVVRTIQVQGNAEVSTQDVILQSGIVQGESVFLIDAEKVKENINAHKLLLFENMNIRFPSTVILTVRTRKPVAQIEYLGFMYAVDDTGRILYKSADLSQDAQLPVVKGLNIRSIVEGEEIRLVDATQFTCVVQLLEELKISNLSLQAHELNVSDLANLYIMTRDGAKIELGDQSDMTVKLAIAQAILRDQADRPLSGAKVDVSSGKDGYFIPAVH